MVSLGVAVALLEAHVTVGEGRLPLGVLFLGVGVILLAGSLAAARVPDRPEPVRPFVPAKPAAPAEPTETLVASTAPPPEPEVPVDRSGLPEPPRPAPVVFPSSRPPATAVGGSRPTSVAGAIDRMLDGIPAAVRKSPNEPSKEADGSQPTCATCGRPLAARDSWRQCRHCERPLCADCLMESVRRWGVGYCSECTSAGFNVNVEPAST